MKPLENLTYRGQLRRLRRLAATALMDYRFGELRMQVINHAENATFRIDVASDSAGEADSSAYVAHRYLLRVHRPGYQTRQSIASELTWLEALRTEAGLAVPAPVPTRQGAFLTEATAPGIAQSRTCSVLRWLGGRFHEGRPSPIMFVALGRLMARLHTHAEQWQVPSDFTRRPWDWDGLFGDNSGYSLSAEKVWGLLPRRYAVPFSLVADRTRLAMKELGTGPEAFGLIHADLHLGNVLFAGGEARAIDFDDCGFGYWMYDFSVPINECLDHENWRDLRDALYEGYTEVRPLSQVQLAYLDTFLAARTVSLVLWAIDQAQVNPHFKEHIDRWLVWAVDRIEPYLAGGD